MLVRPYRRQPGWFKVTHTLMVCLIVLAAVRSLVPGLCATLSASTEQAKSREAVPACCAERIAREAAQPAFRTQQEKTGTPCAFCYLVLGLGQSAPSPAATLAALENIGPEPPAPIHFVQRDVIARSPSRAPPANA